jgi:hypothetical protein
MNRGKSQKKRSGRGLITCTSVRAALATRAARAKATRTTSCNKKLVTCIGVNYGKREIRERNGCVGEYMWNTKGWEGGEIVGEYM